MTHLISPAEIRRRRLALGLSQDELGELLSVAQNTIARWERDELEPEHPGMLKLAFDALENNWTLSKHTKDEIAQRKRRIEALGKRVRTNLNNLKS